MNYNGALVCKNITKLLEDNGKRIGDFESDMLVSTGYVSRTFKDGAKPNINFLINAAKYFDISLDTLLFRDISLPTPDEKKKYDFLHKLIKDTWDAKLEWQPESSSALNDRVYETSGGGTTHDLFEMAECGEGKNRVFKPTFISRSFETNTCVFDDCYHLEMKTGATLYIMFVGYSSDAFDPTPDPEPVKEVWMVLKDGSKHFLCDSNAKNNVGQSVNELYAVIKRAANCPKSSKEVDDAIDAYLNELPELPFEI